MATQIIFHVKMTNISLELVLMKSRIYMYLKEK